MVNNQQETIAYITQYQFELDSYDSIITLIEIHILKISISLNCFNYYF